MIGFHHDMIRWCTLHTLHLGVVNWVVGSGFHMLLAQDSVFKNTGFELDTFQAHLYKHLDLNWTQEDLWSDDGAGIEKRLFQAYQHFNSWTKAHRIQPLSTT